MKSGGELAGGHRGHRDGDHRDGHDPDPDHRDGHDRDPDHRDGHDVDPDHRDGDYGDW